MGTRRSALDLEALAVEALSFIAADQETLHAFLAETGLDPSLTRQAAAQPQFLRGVLAYLISDEALLVRFAADRQLDPEAIGHAVMALERHGRRGDA